MKIEFGIEGKVKGKGRPRFARMGNFTKTYTDNDTVSYENLVKFSFLNALAGYEIEKEKFEGEIRLFVLAKFALPKSATKALRLRVESGSIAYCPKKPDIDNLIKVISDALNKVAYADDAQIVAVTARKQWNEREGVWVGIEYL